MLLVLCFVALCSSICSRREFPEQSVFAVLSSRANLTLRFVVHRMPEGVPTKVFSLQFFLWVVVPFLFCVFGFVVIYALDTLNGKHVKLI